MSLNWKNYGFCVPKPWGGISVQAFLPFITLKQPFPSQHICASFMLQTSDKIVPECSSFPDTNHPKETSIPEQHNHQRSSVTCTHHICTVFPTEPMQNRHKPRTCSKPFYCLFRQDYFPLDLSAQHSCLPWSDQILQILFLLLHAVAHLIEI